VGETETLVEQQPPQGVLVCDHAGLVINKFSFQAVSVGRLRHRASDFAGAVRCLERAAGGDVKAAIYLSEALLGAGDVPRAVATLERVVASDSGARIAFAHLLLGRYHLCAEGTRVLPAGVRWREAGLCRAEI